MPSKRKVLVPILALCAALVLAGCPSDDDTIPDPVMPTYDPADVTDLINHDGGTGGGPNMGTFTVVLFDKETPATRISGATVIVYHGGGQETQDTTDADGKAEFTDIGPGAVTCTAVAGGFIPATAVDLNAATLVIGLEGLYVRIEGQIQGFGANSHLELDFETKEYDEIDKQADNKHGWVVSQTLAGGRVDYMARLRANVTDWFIVKEVSDALGPTRGKIVRRKRVQFGPWTSDQINTAVTDITLDNTTGLYELQITVNNVRLLGVGTVVAWYEENLNRYWSYRSIGPGASWNVFLQMPAGVTGADVIVETYAPDSIPGDDLPLESKKIVVTSGAAEGIGTTTVNLSMVNVSGDFLNPSGPTNIYLVIARYDGRAHASVGFLLASIDYFIRVPNGIDTQFRVLEVSGTGGSGLGEMLSDLVETQNFSADTTHNFDMAGHAMSTLDINTNIPAGINTPGGIALMTGTYDATSKFMDLPFMTAGSDASGQVNFPLKHSDVGGLVSRFFLILIVQEDGVPEGASPQSMYVRGNLTDPAGILTSTPTLSLLDPPEVMAPAHTTTVPRTALQFAWTGDATVSSQGIHTVDIHDNENAKVWSLIVRGSTTQFVLPRLPAALSSRDLKISTTYTFKVMAVSLGTGIDIDDYKADVFPEEVTDILALDETWRMGESRNTEFEVN